MKQFYSLVFILSVFIASCRVDEFSPCDDAPGMEGLLCKEFRFENSESIGYLAYYYNSDKQLTRKDYNATSGELKKYDTFAYENGQISIERSYDSEGKLLLQKDYLYDALSNLSNVYHIENGVEVAYKQFEYSDTLLQKESSFNYNQLENYTVYQYYNGETNLYRKSVYSASNELLNYTTIEYFVNNYERHNHYTGNHVFTGYDVFVYAVNDNITRSSVYDFTGKLMSYIDYVYNTKGQLDVSNQYDEDGKLRKNNKYIYNN
jgi:hypothetical protein